MYFIDWQSFTNRALAHATFLDDILMGRNLGAKLISHLERLEIIESVVLPSSIASLAIEVLCSDQKTRVKIQVTYFKSYIIYDNLKILIMC